MNMKQFVDGGVKEDWKVELVKPDLEQLYAQVLYELVEYEGNCDEHSVVLADSTAYGLLVVLKSMINQSRADSDVINDLTEIAKRDYPE